MVYEETPKKPIKNTKRLAVANTKEWSTGQLVYVVLHRHRFGLLVWFVVLENLYLLLNYFTVI